MIPFILRNIGLWSLVSAYIVHAWAGSYLHAAGGKKRRWQAQLVSLYSRMILKVMGVHLTFKNFRNTEQADSAKALYVCNHLSYLDIMLIASVMPCIFITSRELEKSTLLGRLARLGGCLFVERRSRAFLLEEIDRISGTLDDGVPIVLFAEGTSSNGTGVLPFKVSLFAAAAQAGARVVPVCIKYTKVNGYDIAAHNRDLVYYYGTMTFLPHITKLLLAGSVWATLSFFPPIETRNGANRKKLAGLSHAVISRAFANPVAHG